MLEHLDAYFFLLLVFYVVGVLFGVFFTDKILAPIEGPLVITSVEQNDKRCVLTLNEKFRIIRPCNAKVFVGLEVKLVP